MAFLQKRIGTADVGFGETLRELRELRGFSLEELGRRSGIHALVILSFEENRLEDISDPLYAERHVVALAEALESPPSYLLEKYRDLIGGRHLQKEHPLFPGRRVRSSELFVHSHAIAFGIFLGIVSLIGAYIVWQANIISAVPQLAVQTPTEGAVYEAPSVLVSGVTDPGAFVRINGFSAVVDGKTGAFSLPLDVPRGVSTIEVEAHRRYGSSVTVERHVTYTVPTN